MSAKFLLPTISRNELSITLYLLYVDTQVCTNSRRPAFCWKWTQRSVLLLLLLLSSVHQLSRYCPSILVRHSWAYFHQLLHSNLIDVADQMPPHLLKRQFGCHVPLCGSLTATWLYVAARVPRASRKQLECHVPLGGRSSAMCL